MLYLYMYMNLCIYRRDRRQTKQFCFLDADCLVVGESQRNVFKSVLKAKYVILKLKNLLLSIIMKISSSYKKKKRIQ